MPFVYPKERHLEQLDSQEAIRILHLIDNLNNVDTICDILEQENAVDYEIPELWNNVFIKAVETQAIANSLYNKFDGFIQIVNSKLLKCLLDFDFEMVFNSIGSVSDGIESNFSIVNLMIIAFYKIKQSDINIAKEIRYCLTSGIEQCIQLYKNQKDTVFLERCQAYKTYLEDILL